MTIPTTAAAWRPILERQLEWAANQLTKADAELQPIITLYPDDETAPSEVIYAPFTTDAEEEALHTFLAVKGVALQTRAATHIAEAWVRSITRRPGESDAELQQRGEAVEPSKAEDRTEVVIITAVWRDRDWQRHVLVGTRQIERDALGVPSLGATRWLAEPKTPLRVAVPRSKPPYEAVEQAKLVLADYEAGVRHNTH